MKPIAFIAGAGIAYLIYRGISSKSSGKRELTAEEMHKTPTGNILSAEVEFEVSGLEKSLKASPEYVKNKIAPAVTIIRSIACNHMPVLSDVQPKILVRDSHIGYVIRINWPATFSDSNRGDVSPELRDCIYKGVMAHLDSKTKERVKRFRIFRD